MNTGKAQAQHARDMVGHLLWAYEQAPLQLRRLYSLLELGDHEDDMAAIVAALEPLSARLTDSWPELLHGDTKATLDAHSLEEEQQRRASQSTRIAFNSWARFWEQEHVKMLRLKHESSLLNRLERLQ